MRLIFFIFSIAYIAAIFLFTGSPVVSDLAPFNPCSLLHIPLYGILTVLLIFSFVPIKLNRVNSFSRLRFNDLNVLNEPNDPNDLNGPNELNEPNGINEPNVLNGPNEPNVLNECNALTHTRIHASTHIRFFLSGVIALMVAVADEIHQSVIPVRDASITDVFLDAIGIILALFIIVKFYRKKKQYIRISAYQLADYQNTRISEKDVFN
jgi:hypothetical protein